MTTADAKVELAERLNALAAAVMVLDWKDTVPDDLQSEVRMLFNEALAGGPNMNGDGGPTLTPNHALDCVWAAQRIAALEASPNSRTEAITPEMIEAGVAAWRDPSGFCDCSDAVREVYTAMQAARPIDREDGGASPLATGFSQAEPEEVSALRASIPSAGDRT